LLISNCPWAFLGGASYAVSAAKAVFASANVRIIIRQIKSEIPLCSLCLMELDLNILLSSLIFYINRVPLPASRFYPGKYRVLS
jgi:hypothetical protein